MKHLRCPNSECGSQGPFVVPDASASADPSQPWAMKCPLCGATVGFFESRRPEPPDDRYEETLSRIDVDLRDIKHRLQDETGQRTLVRVETALRNVQGGLSALRARLANLEGRMARKR